MTKHKRCFKPIYWSLVVIVSLFSLMGCLGNTIESTDKGTAFLSVSKKKALTPRGSVGFGYVGTRGTDSRSLSRIDDVSFDELVAIETTHVIHSIFANYSFNVVNGEVFKLGIAPVINLSHYDIDIDGENINDSRDETFFTYGLKFEPSIRLNERLSLVGHYSVHGSSDEAVYDAGLSILFDRNAKPNVIAGFRILALNGNNRFPESDVALISSGLHLGLTF